MNDLLNQNIATNAETLKPKIIKKALPGKLEASQLLKYIFICSYILIPILSVESLVTWSIGAIGLYKTVNLYKGESPSKVKKSIGLFAVLLAAAIAYNHMVDYIAKLFM
jgi:hypothetical protein